MLLLISDSFITAIFQLCEVQVSFTSSRFLWCDNGDHMWREPPDLWPLPGHALINSPELTVLAAVSLCLPVSVCVCVCINLCEYCVWVPEYESFMLSFWATRVFVHVCVLLVVPVTVWRCVCVCALLSELHISQQIVSLQLSPTQLDFTIWPLMLTCTCSTYCPQHMSLLGFLQSRNTFHKSALILGPVKSLEMRQRDVELQSIFSPMERYSILVFLGLEMWTQYMHFIISKNQHNK